MIEEAIEELRTAKSPRLPFDEVRRKKALQLGIEALELYFALRQCTAIDVEDIPSRLPSEGER